MLWWKCFDKMSCRKGKDELSGSGKDLLNIENKGSRAENYKSWKLNFLTDPIFNLHHNYEEENILFIQQYRSRTLQVPVLVYKFNLNMPKTDIHHF